MTSTPHSVGHQCAGTIVEVGGGATDRSVGQRVVATMPSGSHAELVAVPAVVTWVVPEGADVVAAACVPVAFGTADDCLFEFGHLEAGETVLIQAGAGGVGLAAIQLAKRANATVIATASSDERLDRLREFGMDHGINYSERGWVEAKLVVWALVLAAFASHALTASRQRRVWLSALMLVLSLTAVGIGTHLTEM